MAECPKHGRTYLMNGECVAGAGPEVSDLCGWLVPADADEARGLYEKWNVGRVSDPHNKHAACEHFVLDLTHDPFSVPALRAYADACERLYPKLAADLRKKLGTRGELADDLGELADEVARLRNNLGAVRKEKKEIEDHFRREVQCALGWDQHKEAAPDWALTLRAVRSLREAAETWFPRIARLAGDGNGGMYDLRTWAKVHDGLTRKLDHLKARLFDFIERETGRAFILTE
jgi:hypothetical protein